MSFQTGLGIRQKWTLTANNSTYAYTGNTATLTFTPVATWNQFIFNGTQGATSTTLTTVWTANLVNPSLILVQIYQFVTGGASVTGVSDSAGNSYSLVVTNNVGTLHGYIYAASNTSSAANVTLTVTVSPAAHIAIGAVEMLDTATTSTATSSDSQATAGNTPNAGTLSSVPAGGFAFVGYGCAANPSLLAMPTTPDATTTIGAGGTLPTTPITVGNTAGFPSWGFPGFEGAINIVIGAAVTTVEFTGTTPTTFTGCSGGSGTFVNGDPVDSAVAPVARLLTPTYDIGISVGLYYSPSAQSNLAFPWHGTVSAGSIGVSASYAVSGPTVH